MNDFRRLELLETAKDCIVAAAVGHDSQKLIRALWSQAAELNLRILVADRLLVIDREPIR